MHVAVADVNNSVLKP